MLSVLRNEHGKAIIDPTLGEELLKLLLNGYVQSIKLNYCESQGPFHRMIATYLRTDVESAPLPVSFRGKLRSEFAVLVEGDVIGNEGTILAHSVDGQSTVVAVTLMIAILLSPCLWHKSGQQHTLLMDIEHRMGYA